MDKKDEKRKKILKKITEDSIQYESDSKNNGIWSSLKLSFFNTKDSLIYNYINRGTYFNYSEYKKVNLFNNTYYLNNDEGQTLFEQKFQKIIYFSYRKNYPPQTNYKNNIEYTSDCGWGCMIRSSQMIFARAIYKILKMTNLPEMSLKLTIYYFLDYPINTNKFPNVLTYYYKYLDNKLKLKNSQLNKKIFSPFSLRNICNAGEIFNLTCGEWFSDPKLVTIYDFLNENMNIIPKLKIINCVSEINLRDIINKCFQKYNINEAFGPDNELILYNNDQYTLKYYGLIFVSVRLGIYNISNEYFEGIKNLFSCKEFLGFIGGKDYAASYFIGFNDKNVLYIDPHFSQECVIPPIEDNNIKSYFDKIIYQLPFERLQPAFTMGFLFRDIKEYNDLVLFFQTHFKLKFPCFYYQEDYRINKEIKKIGK